MSGAWEYEFQSDGTAQHHTMLTDAYQMGQDAKQRSEF